MIIILVRKDGSVRSRKFHGVSLPTKAYSDIDPNVSYTLTSIGKQTATYEED